MASLDGFDANQHEPNAPLTPIPNGRYQATITASERKETKSKNGQFFLALEFTVQGGEHNGRKVHANLNLWNQSQQAVSIARGDMSAICRSVNVMQPRDSVELHNIPLMIDVVVDSYMKDGEKKLKNEIKGFLPRNHTESVAEPATASSAGSAPWGP